MSDQNLITDSEDSKKLLALQDLVRTEKDLVEIAKKSSVFNPFDVLKVSHAEIRHSNVLAWLFNPQGNHGFGDWFLKSFLIQVCLENETHTTIPLSKLYTMDFSDTVVYREYKHIDLYLESKQNNTVIVIENKIHANESKNQLKQYLTTVETTNTQNETVIIPIFLTLEGDEPSGDERYLIMSHIQMIDILDQAITKANDSGKLVVSQFITYYKKTIGDLTVGNSEIEELARAIYKKHKLALDTIFDIALQSSYDAVFDDFKLQHPNAVEVKRWSSYAVYIPETLISLPDVDHEWISRKPVILWIWFRQNNDTLGFTLEVGPLDMSSGRIAFMKYLKNENGIKTNKRTFQEGAKYTRIFTKSYKFTDWEDTDKLIEKLINQYDAFIGETQHIQQRIVDYDWLNWQSKDTSQ